MAENVVDELDRPDFPALSRNIEKRKFAVA
jgi:hypothetical protein